MIGPNLFGIVGRSIGDVEGFAYSNALATLGQKNAAWTPELLMSFLANPAEAIPGNRMPFVGIDNDDNLRDLVAYLATLR